MPLSLPRRALACVLATALLFASARASANDDDHNTVDVRAGYAFAWTTGLQYLGRTVGFAVSHRFWGRFHVEGRGYFHRGEETHARGPGVTFDQSARSLSIQAVAGYAIWIAHRLTITPSVALDTTYTWETTSIGVANASDHAWLFGVGPDLSVLFHGRDVVFGVDGQALFVPTRIPSPAVGLVVVLGLDF